MDYAIAWRWVRGSFWRRGHYDVVHLIAVHRGYGASDVYGWFFVDSPVPEFPAFIGGGVLFNDYFLSPELACFALVNDSADWDLRRLPLFWGMSAC